jgi:hypothetical protein
VLERRDPTGLVDPLVDDYSAACLDYPGYDVEIVVITTWGDRVIGTSTVYVDCSWYRDLVGLGSDAAGSSVVQVGGRPGGGPGVTGPAGSSPNIPVLVLRRDTTWTTPGIPSVAFHDKSALTGDPGTWVLWYRTTLDRVEGVPIPGGVGVYTGLWIPDNPREYDPTGVMLTWPA